MRFTEQQINYLQIGKVYEFRSGEAFRFIRMRNDFLAYFIKCVYNEDTSNYIDTDILYSFTVSDLKDERII